MNKMILNNFTVTKIVDEAKSYTNTKSKVVYKENEKTNRNRHEF